MSENVFVRGESNSNFEAMTKEEVLAAIVQAIEGGTIGDIDTGFVTTIKEQNKGQGLMFWVGTTAEYEALAEKPNNVLYIKTDDTSATDINNNFATINGQISTINSALAKKLEIAPADYFVQTQIPANSSIDSNAYSHSFQIPEWAIPIVSVTTLTNRFADSTKVKYQVTKRDLTSAGYTGDTPISVTVFVWNESDVDLDVDIRWYYIVPPTEA